MSRRRHVHIPHRDGASVGEVITTGHHVERLPPSLRQVLVRWSQGPHAGRSGWVPWSVVKRWVR